MFWPFEENEEKSTKTRRRVAPRTAHVSSIVQGGFGTVLIDVADEQRPGQQPSRWESRDPSKDVASLERANVIPATSRGKMTEEWRPTVGAKCNARYKRDREWYLCTILKITDKGLEVRFESRGNQRRATVLPANVKPVVWNRPLTSQWSR